MNRLLNLTLLTLIAGYLGCLSPTLVMATDIEARNGEVTPSPSPTPPLRPRGMVIGETHLPAEVLQKLDADQLTAILKQQVSSPKTPAEQVFSEDVLVPGIVFLSLTTISFLLIYFSFRKRREMLDTVRVAIQSGQTLPATFLEALESKSKPKPTPDGDLRRAVLLIALGLSGTFVLALMGDKEIGRAWSIGLVPTLLGVGYLFLWRQSQKRLKAGLPNDQR